MPLGKLMKSRRRFEWLRGKPDWSVNKKLLKEKEGHHMLVAHSMKTVLSNHKHPKNEPKVKLSKTQVDVNSVTWSIIIIVGINGIFV